MGADVPDHDPEAFDLPEPDEVLTDRPAHPEGREPADRDDREVLLDDPERPDAPVDDDDFADRP
jgi:hypothetical protein